MAESPKQSSIESGSHSKSEKYGSAVVALALMGLPLSHGVESHASQDRVAIEVAEPDPSSVEIQVATTQVPIGEATTVIGETSSAHMERADHILPYERDFHTEAEEQASGLEFARNFVAEHMPIFADPDVKITSIRVVGTASAEHGNDDMAGLTTPYEANNVLAQERASIGASSLQTALTEAMPGNAERLAELPPIEVDSEVVTPTQEKLDALIALAESRGVTVNELVDDFNQNPDRLDSLTESELQVLKDVLEVRGFRIEFQYEVRGEPITITTQPEMSTVTIGSIKPAESTPPQGMDAVMERATDTAQFIVRNENARLEETTPVVKKETIIIDPPRKHDTVILKRNDSQFKGSFTRKATTRRDAVPHRIKQPGRGNYHNAHAGKAQRGKPGGQKHMSRKGRK